MDEEIIQQILDEVLGALEPIEAYSAAAVQFLKAKGLATDEEFAPFLEEAKNTASVRWLGVRVRTAALIAHAMIDEESVSEEENPQPSLESRAREEATRADQQLKQSRPTAEPEESGENNQKPALEAKGEKEGAEPRPDLEKSGTEPSGKKKTDQEDAGRPPDSETDSDSPLSDPPLFGTGKSENRDSAKSASDVSGEKRGQKTQKKSDAA
jgi:hypothetical protein